MAFLLFGSGKKADEKRAEVAAQRGWQYNAERNKVNHSNPDEDSNIMYRLSGETAGGQKWEMVARKQARHEDDSSMMAIELYSSTEFITTKAYDDYFLIMPYAGFDLPAFALAEIFSRLEFPVDTPRAEDSALPAGLAKKYVIYSKNPAAIGSLDKLATGLEGWRAKFPGQNKALIIAGGPKGIKIRTEMQVTKETDMEFFVDTALGIVS